MTRILTPWKVCAGFAKGSHSFAQANEGAGLGRAWLSRSQNVLSRIHHDEGSSSSGRSSSRPGTGNGATYTSSDEARDAARAAAEADSRIHTSDYVEARGILLPSTEYFARAVTVAEGKEALSGDLLALVSLSDGERNTHCTRDEALIYYRQRKLT